MGSEESEEDKGGFKVLLGLIITLVAFLIAKQLYKRTHLIICNPLITAPLIIITILLSCGISLQQYEAGGEVWMGLLKPATVAFALPLYRYRHIVKKYIVELLLVVMGAGSLAMATTFVFAEFAHLNHALSLSMAPRSITTPLAINISSTIGGIPTVTAIFVIITGITGMIIASAVIRYFRLRHPLLKGMLLGITAHGTGAAKGYEDNQTTGAIASLSMIFTGILSTIMAPAIIYVCSQLVEI